MKSVPLNDTSNFELISSLWIRNTWTLEVSQSPT